MPKKLDPAKEKAKKQKLIAIVGGVILLALLAFQLPRTMKMLKNPGNVTTSSSTTTASTTAAGSTPLAPPTLEGGATAAAAGADGGGSADTSHDGVRDPSTPLPPDAGQLVSFSRFKSKDPFVPQVKDCGVDDCAPTTPAGGGTGAGAATPVAGGGAGGAGGGTSAAPALSRPSRPTAPAAPAAPVSTAVISVNGKAESVAVGKTFPAADPLFVLRRLTRTVATITIAGGSLEGGAPSVRLPLGKTITLLNTADGTTYAVKLVRVA